MLALQDQIYREMGPERRFELAWELSLFAREFALSGIRNRHPEYSETEIMDAYVHDILLADSRPFGK
jgi:hypothetical protein